MFNYIQNNLKFILSCTKITQSGWGWRGSLLETKSITVGCSGANSTRVLIYINFWIRTSTFPSYLRWGGCRKSCFPPFILKSNVHGDVVMVQLNFRLYVLLSRQQSWLFNKLEGKTPEILIMNRANIFCLFEFSLKSQCFESNIKCFAWSFLSHSAALGRVANEKSTGTKLARSDCAMSVKKQQWEMAAQWVWSQRGCEIPIFGDVQNLARRGPDQPVWVQTLALFSVGIWSNQNSFLTYIAVFLVSGAWRCLLATQLHTSTVQVPQQCRKSVFSWGSIAFWSIPCAFISLLSLQEGGLAGSMLQGLRGRRSGM